ncbi:hypothetical protein N7462_006673 [Penicillium macrosclerotiorum]|uniref:uncharacterized protein n=1 Tax=Penicillium macrosclerotiorum TaxID=303699 RepID=UPI002548E98B|nr:uncharacterized protein N7462_006673 [Penicillium macrosclerotiorum]KAJ5683508.1 hypothetical protein N7462_006673 [Penicillium macrosclerotiorum]
MTETDSGYDHASGEEEHILKLPNNRQIAYAHNGPKTSRTVVIFFTGIMSVGIAPRVPKPCREIGAHWISPTPPGMGNSSTRDTSVPYSTSLARDISALLSHLYPTDDFDILYVSGGSYGTVAAQMIYGAPYELFPPGRKIAGCLLMGGFAPLKYYAGYAKSLSWQGWFSIGPPTQFLPFHLIQWLFRAAVGFKLKTAAGAKAFLRQTLIDIMDDEEHATFQSWLKENGLTEDAFVESMAQGMTRSCQNWDGTMEVSDVIHSDWGFEPKALDETHASKPVLVVGSSADRIGGATNDWIVENYKSASLKVIPGGHISSLFYMDEIWQEMINLTSS